MSISGSMAGTTESAAYTYDDLGRLVTSNQNSNGSSAQRRFAYDRWGNRTGMWDATSGGNQIQSIALEQSAGAPTNRIQSVTASGGATPAAYWNFDETSGTTAADSSGNGNTGTLTNGPTWTSGKVNGALSFDGTNDTVSVASNTSVTNITNNFTLAFWVNPQSAHEIDGEATSGYGGVSGQKYAWGPAWYDESSGHSGAGVSVGTNGVSVYEHAGNYMPPLLVYQASLKGWTHVAVVYENRQPKLYVNGTLVRTGLTSPKSFIHVTPANIGGMAYGYFNGQMDDVRVYNQVLSASEVLALSQPNPATNYTYDSAGNVTNDVVHTYQYDAENRLVNVDSGATGQYAYDASNRRYKKVTGGATSHYIWQGSQVIAEHDGSTGASTADYVYSGSRMIAKATGLTTQYFLSDRLSERLMLNTSGNVIGRQAHLPFGEDFGESGTQEKHHYSSYERDSESGSDYAVNRYYSPQTAKFISVDPIQDMGFKAMGIWGVSKGNCSAHLMKPQNSNRFNYTWNDPVNKQDPLGLTPPPVEITDPCWKNAFSECLKREAGSITEVLELIAEAALCAGACIAAGDNPLGFPACVACTAKVLRDLIKGGKDKYISTIMFIRCWAEANDKCPKKKSEGGGGGDASGKPGPGGSFGGDPYGFGATSSFLDWLEATNPVGRPEGNY